MKIVYLTFLAGVALVAPLKAIDSDGTIRLYLLDHGYNHLENDFVGKVTRYMEANRIEHIDQVDLYASPFALQDPALTNTQNTQSPVIASLPKGTGECANQITEVERTFDTNKLHQDEIGHLLKSAGYNLNESELGTARRLVKDYGPDFVVQRFRVGEVTLLRLYFLTTATDKVRSVRNLFAVADEMATNEVEPFVNSMVLKKYGLFK